MPVVICREARKSAMGGHFRRFGFGNSSVQGEFIYRKTERLLKDNRRISEG